MKYVLGFALGILLNIGTVQGQECSGLEEWRFVALNEDDVLISVLRLNGRPLLDAIDIYQVKDTFLVPLSTLENKFKLKWQIDTQAKGIEFENDEELEGLCEFSFTLKNNGTRSGLIWSEDSFDIYVDIKAIEIMLGGQASFSYELLQLNIFSKISYPGLKELSKVDVPTFTQQGEKLPDRVLPDKYHAFTYPLLNYRLNATHQEQEKAQLSANINAAFDFLHHSTNFRLNANNEDTQGFLRFSRNLELQDNELRALRYEFGDIQLQGNDLINSAEQALGVAISNADIRQARSFSAITLEEFVLPGWQAQLFRNGQFVEEVFSSADNRVVFDEVETFYGNNLFEIKLYGPDGQQETRTQNINVGKDQIERGAMRYYLAVSDATKRLIDKDSDSGEFDKKLVANVMYGLSDHLTLQTGFHSLGEGETQQHYLATSLDMSLAGANIKTQYAKQFDGGHAIFAGLNGRVSQGLKINLSARLFDDFNSEAYQAQRGLKGDVRARLNGKTEWIGGASWGLNLAHRAFNEASDSSVIGLKINKNLLGGTFSGGLDYSSTAQDETINNRIYYSKNVHGWQVSGALDWLPFDNQKIKDFYANLRWPQTYSSYNETRLEYRPEREHKTTLRHQYNWRLEQMNFALGTSLDSGGQWSVNLSISGDLEYDPFNEQFNFYRPRGSQAANIHAFAFLDNNRNAIFDQQDSPLSDVVIYGNQSWKNKKTTQQGYVQLISTNSQQGVKIESASLPDPYMHPVDELVYINTHQGGVNHVSLPVVTFNDIEGAIYQVRDNTSRGVSSINVALIEETGQVVAQTETEIDGYFFMSQVPPGQYKIQVDPAYLLANSLSIANLPKAINAPQEGDSLRIDDVLLVDFSQDMPGAKPVVDVQQFVVQLGVFKKSRSLFEVIKQLPTERYPLSIYRHHAKGLSYVVLDGFSKFEEASKALAEIHLVTAFKGAFVVSSSRFKQPYWHKESELKNVDSLIEQSHQKLKAMPENKRVCQLASLQSLSSLAIDEFEQDARLLLVRRLVEGVRYYSIIGTKEDKMFGCKQEFEQHPYGFQAFGVPAKRLASQLF